MWHALLSMGFLKYSYFSDDVWAIGNVLLYLKLKDNPTNYRKMEEFKFFGLKP